MVAVVGKQMIILLALMGIGYILNKINIMNAAISKGLSKVVVNVALPALILASVMEEEGKHTNRQIVTIIGIALLCYSILILMAFVGPTFLRTSGSIKGNYQFMILFGNVGFIGYPVVSAIWGKEGIFVASMINLPFSFLVFTLGVYFLNQKASKAKFSFLKCLNAGTIASIAALGIAFFHIGTSSYISETCSLLGQMTTPAALLIIGSSLADMPLRELRGDVKTYMVCVIRLIINPIIVWMVFRLFIHDSMLLGVTVILSALPVASNGMMMCLEYDGNPKAMGQGTFITTVLSVITIPIVVHLL